MERGNDDDVTMTSETLNPFLVRFDSSTDRPFPKTSCISDCGLQPCLLSYLFIKPVVDSTDAHEPKRQDFLRGHKTAHYPDFVFSSTTSGASCSPESVGPRLAAIAVFRSSYMDRQYTPKL